MSIHRESVLQQIGITIPPIPRSASTGSGASRRTGVTSNRFSVSHLYSVVAERDVEVEDDLAKGNWGVATRS
jgi:hypothetical protein